MLFFLRPMLNSEINCTYMHIFIYIYFLPYLIFMYSSIYFTFLWRYQQFCYQKIRSLIKSLYCLRHFFYEGAIRVGNTNNDHPLKLNYALHRPQLSTHRHKLPVASKIPRNAQSFKYITIALSQYDLTNIRSLPTTTNTILLDD